MGSMVDAKLSSDPAVCLALNRNYKRFISEHVKNISLVLEHNRQRQVKSTVTVMLLMSTDWFLQRKTQTYIVVVFLFVVIVSK